MHRVRSTLIAVVLLLAPGVASAQLLAEVALTPAIASQLFPPVSWPTGSLRAVGSGVDALVARVVPDRADWRDWEAYTAGGIAASLEGALVYGVERDLLMQGLFRSETTETTVGSERRTRVLFSDGGTRTALLVVLRSGQELVWLVARGR